MRVWIPLALAWCAATAAEPIPGVPNGREPVEVPDPIGLGERLALIDWLREAKISFPEEATIELLRLAYLRSAKPELFQAEVDAATEAAFLLESRQQVAGELWSRHRVAAKAEQTVPELEALLQSLDAKQSDEIARLADESRDPADPVDRAKERFGDTKPDKPIGKDASRRPPASGAVDKPAAAPAGGIPALDDENAGKWTNYHNPVQQARDDIELRVYCLVGDQAAYYLWANNRTDNERLVRCLIGDRTCTIYIGTGRCLKPLKVTVASWSPEPPLRIDSVERSYGLPNAGEMWLKR